MVETAQSQNRTDTQQTAKTKRTTRLLVIAIIVLAVVIVLLLLSRTQIILNPLVLIALVAFAAFVFWLQYHRAKGAYADVYKAKERIRDVVFRKTGFALDITPQNTQTEEIGQNRLAVWFIAEAKGYIFDPGIGGIVAETDKNITDLLRTYGEVETLKAIAQGKLNPQEVNVT